MAFDLCRMHLPLKLIPRAFARVIPVLARNMYSHSETVVEPFIINDDFVVEIRVGSDGLTRKFPSTRSKSDL